MLSWLRSRTQPRRPGIFSLAEGEMIPYAFQHYAKDFYEAYKKHKSNQRFSPARFFLLTRSIELAGKALHAGNGFRNFRKLGHGLKAACKAGVLAKYAITLTSAEQAELRKADRYYKVKGFEYYLFSFRGEDGDLSGAQAALTGWQNLPNEAVLEAIVEKLLTPQF